MGVPTPDWSSWQPQELYPFQGVYLGQSALPVEPDTLVYLQNDVTDAAQVSSCLVYTSACMGCWTKTLRSNHFRPGAPPFDKEGEPPASPVRPAPFAPTAQRGQGAPGTIPTEGARLFLPQKTGPAFRGPHGSR